MQIPSASRFTCDWIFNILVVLCDGKVVCGCADPYGERPLGHFDRSPLYEIWNSEKVKKIRRDLNRGGSAFCRDCGLKRPLAEGEKIAERPEHLEVLPRIFFEPTILCNLSCFQAVCSQESGIIQTRARTQFPFPQFQELIREIGKDLVRLDFFNYGESFVHPQAVDMIEYIKNTFPHIYLYTSTNGLMLDEDKIRRLVGAGLDEITFSVDGPDPETYIRYRRRGSLPALLSLMERFVQERDAVGREVPYINWRYILFKWNDSRRKMNKARKLAAKIGVDRLTWEITDHPPEAVSPRYQIGSPHWRRIYHEIWDSSQIGNALPGRRFTAKIRPRTAAFRTEIGRTAALDVTVKNTGGAAWRRSSYSGRRLVRLGAQLFDGNRCLLDLNFARTWLRHDMEKGETTALTLEFPAVEHTGEYWLKLDMVAEGVDWFESGGSPVAWVRWDIFEPPPPP